MNLKVSLPIVSKDSETAKAIQFTFPVRDTYNETVQHWIPISQIYEIHPNRVVISDWIAKKLELI